MTRRPNAPRLPHIARLIYHQTLPFRPAQPPLTPRKSSLTPRNRLSSRAKHLYLCASDLYRRASHLSRCASKVSACATHLYLCASQVFLCATTSTRAQAMCTRAQGIFHRVSHMFQAANVNSHTAPPICAPVPACLHPPLQLCIGREANVTEYHASRTIKREACEPFMRKTARLYSS